VGNYFIGANAMLINGRNLNVEISGPEDSPVVILLHHGLGSTRAWKSQVEALSHENWRTIVYDRWGYGKSEARPQLSVPYFNDDLDDLEKLLDKLKIEQAALVGHSDGGTIALYFAARCQERVVCLVTVAAHAYVEAKMEPGVESLCAEFEGDPRFRAAFRRVHGVKSEKVFSNWYNGWHKPENLDWDMRPLLRHITAPTLVVQGCEDEYATPQHARDIAAAIPGAVLWLAEGAKHMFPQDAPERFNARLLDFLADIRKGMENKRHVQ
jgi:pimeloyl-ACP methyl ester carboxylesterase